MTSAYDAIYRRPFDGVLRRWFGASVTNPNVQQCPRCRGTDKVDSEQEGYGITLFHCARCDREWWS